MILELHADESYVLIDELYPPQGRQTLLEGDMADSEELTREHFANRSVIERLLERLAYSLRHWL